MKLAGRSALQRAGADTLFAKSGKKRKFARGSTLMRFDCEEPSVFLLTEGTAALQVTHYSQVSELNIAHLIPGDVFGNIEPGEGNKIEMYVVAKTDCFAYVITAEELRQACASQPLALFAICRELSRTSVRSLRKVGQFAFYDVRGRVSSALVELCGLPCAISHPEGYLLKNTRVEIASMVGCTREMVGKVMKELSEEGLISIRGRQTLVHASTKR
ncbi:cyclic nucleotide-binding domain-containing protein (plasmid) [Pseudomonas cannabina pv. alisalensis]|uniref:Cyclic nucleotide-binding domain-containing protein n=1 Tax=Pseudomonas syringae pv. maculicola str. ES4326 TaxID=629265 RepID=A0A8T8CAM1_PSEYM|nr:MULTISPECIES: helix-turn-helix domain-containing protein [Pseudomonas syringae group]QHF00562.1 cyclic nucleotide-binding domain-containing protein [Pseudomonas syringae pv. maculicola str. ES4326]UBZ00546.1 cyclic nucleotide-binding domain-containing protein [Pseudomonas cannabina pv. alisalensis]